MNVIDFPTGTITHLTLQSKATDLYSRARQLSPAPAVLVLESAEEAALLVGLVHWVLEHQTGEVCLQPL